MNNEPRKSPKEPTKLQKIRGNRKFRLWLIAGLLALVAILFIFFEKLRIGLAIAFVLLLGAFGLEVSQNDWDLGKLWETKSFQESKIVRDESGNVLFDKFGEITTDSSKGKKANDYNCADFSTQPEAQSFFIKVGGVGNDVNRLDGNKDGDACESLPQGSK
ncbi:excalibur calcium-binding domain-containing protein [Candidatus Woesebacteria bacterium]|nr:excalibur calcium-binding domain-containing protein [Candidatus Woesebacteria bacterium]